MHDLFEILGVEPDAAAAEIRRACRRRLQPMHPDVVDDERPSTGCLWPAADRESSDRDRLEVGQAPIDFGAMAPLVARMRVAFFGTHADAFIVTVPMPAVLPSPAAPLAFDVPALVLCRACAGRGEVADAPCPRCEARGLVKATRAVKVALPESACRAATIRLEVSRLNGPATRVRVRVLSAS